MGDRVTKAASKATGISAGKKRGVGEQVVEWLTGIPTDPDFYRNASRQEIFMNTAPQIAIGALGLSRLPKPKGSPVRNAIAKDPYGLDAGPSDRRVFLDKLAGNTTKRAVKESDRLWNKANTDEGFNKAADFSETFNKQYGWPNTVSNPEAIGTFRDPNYTKPSGLLDSAVNAIKSRIKR